MKTSHTNNSLLVALGFILAASLLPVAALAELAVITHPGDGVASMSAGDVKAVFLGKNKVLPGGAKAVPVGPEEGSATYGAFADKVLGKSESQLKAYWSKLIFSGKGTPPNAFADDAAVKAFVAKTPGAIGYIDGAAVDGSVTVVLTVK